MSDATKPTKPAAAPDAAPAVKAPRFIVRAGVYLVDQKGKGRFAPIPGVTQALADECNANPDRFEHFISVPGKPPASES